MIGRKFNIGQSLTIYVIFSIVFFTSVGAYNYYKKSGISFVKVQKSTKIDGEISYFQPIGANSCELAIGKNGYYILNVNNFNYVPSSLASLVKVGDTIRKVPNAVIFHIYSTDGKRYIFNLEGDIHKDTSSSDA